MTPAQQRSADLLLHSRLYRRGPGYYRRWAAEPDRRGGKRFRYMRQVAYLGWKSEHRTLAGFWRPWWAQQN